MIFPLVFMVVSPEVLAGILGAGTAICQALGG